MPDNFYDVCKAWKNKKLTQKEAAKALSVNKNLKTMIRGLDMDRFLDSADVMLTDFEYPTYLYDNNPFNDASYLLNRDIIFGREYQMTLDIDKENFKPGITAFDDYSRWQSPWYTFGINTVSLDGVIVTDTEQLHLSDEEKEVIRKNIEQNVTGVADRYPDVDFYYFYPPYSVIVWNGWKTNGILHKQLEAEAYVTELIVPHKNIYLFSFNNRTDITANLNNYKDDGHYGSWVNSLMLRWMHDGQYQLTEDNFKDYLKQEYEFYTTFDYASVNGQEDYEAYTGSADSCYQFSDIYMY